jgi:hypothetical protein
MKYTKAFYGLAVLAGALTAAASTMSAPAQTRTQGENVCLNVVYLKNTKPTDVRTIMYTMTNGDIWRNDLAYPCPDLIHQSAGGYSQVSPIGGWICANTQQITTQTGMVCRLGQFTRVN